MILNQIKDKISLGLCRTLSVIGSYLIIEGRVASAGRGPGDGCLNWAGARADDCRKKVDPGDVPGRFGKRKVLKVNWVINTSDAITNP